MSKEILKKKAAWILCKLRMDALWRQVNRSSLLIVTYHGIYDRFDRKSLPLFNHLHVDLFREHLQFLKTHYNVISLTELITCLKEGTPWPKRSALITFDDGYRNNYEVAFPALKEFDLPSVIFLTVDYIGADKFFWFDELYLLLQQAMNSSVELDLLAECLGIPPTSRNIGEQYPIFSNRLKKMSNEERMGRISCLKSSIAIEDNALAEHFKMLSWEQVLEMKLSGLVEFGVHTATHRIVSEIAKEDWKKEIIKPKKKMEEKLNCDIPSFCFPNGIPGVDFSNEHERFIESNGYICAFSSNEILNARMGNQYRLGRIAVGNDITSDMDFFRLNMSGIIAAKLEICGDS